jgi:hypothetical protein
VYNRVVTGDIIIAEFLQGFRDERDFLEAKKIMESLEYRDFLGKEIAIQAAQNFLIIEKKGNHCSENYRCYYCYFLYRKWIRINS